MRRDGVKELSWFYDNLRISTNAGPCCDRDVTGICVGARIGSSFSSSLSAVKDAFEGQIGIYRIGTSAICWLIAMSYHLSLIHVERKWL